MNSEPVDLSALAGHVENELEEQYPGWLITRDSSGRWTAVRSEWGTLYGQTSAELRDRLARYVSGSGTR